MKYRYIQSWGHMMGSQQWYIDGQIELAKKDNAPETATFKRDNGTWATIEDCENSETAYRVRAYAENMS